ncbi:MAG: sugar O-acetyltransferase [Glaciecola sp.]
MSELSEKQKQAQGLPYYGSDKTLSAEREHAKRICHQFNQFDISDRKGSRKLIKSLVGKYAGAWIEPPFYCDYGYNIKLGKHFYANHGLIILDCATVNIGDNVMIAPGVLMSTATHPLNAQERIKGLETANPITIGNNVWIGMGAKILDGVTIGDNAVIAAGAVVNKNVEANTMVAGVPAVFIKHV